MLLSFSLATLGFSAQHPSFDAFLAKYHKQYAGAEYSERRAAYEAAVATIEAHNAASPSWTMKLSEHADKLPHEWSNLRGLDRSAHFRNHAARNYASRAAAPSDLPASVDWRTTKMVTPVKNQEACGSCWAFSATETVESALAMAGGPLLTLAPQQLVDCAPNPQQCGGTGGCQGSTQPLAFNYTVSAGMDSEAAYPYKGRDGTCSAASKSPAVGITGLVELPTNDYDALMQAVATVGPIAISVDASAWSFYGGGVYSGKCGTTIDHAVQLVGYGTDSQTNEDYWLVRNSWGTSWGEDGYMRIKRYGAGDEPCGTDTAPDEGYGCKGGPSTLKVCGLCGILSASSYPTGAYAK